MLEQFKGMVEEEKEVERCIYCRESISLEETYIVAYMNKSNLVSKAVLNRETQFHIFFSTCGHRVHKQCYLDYQKEKASEFKCFLCKKATNTIVPEISKMQTMSFEGRDALTRDYLDSIAAVIFSPALATHFQSF